jgi:hypothetical protein
MTSLFTVAVAGVPRRWSLWRRQWPQHRRVSPRLGMMAYDAPAAKRCCSGADTDHFGDT